MCAISKARIRNTRVKVYMGYYGGNITVGDLTYDEDKTHASRDEIIACLSKYRKTELTMLIVDLIDNAEEG